MVEYDIREELFNRDFLQGFLNEKMIKGLRISPLIPKQELKHDTFTWFEYDKSEEEMISSGSMHKPRLIAEGAVLEEIRMDGFSPKTGRVSKRGYQFTLSENYMERDPTEARSILKKMGNLAYGLGRWVEEINWTGLKASAIAGGVTSTTAKPLIGDNGEPEKALIQYETDYDLDDFSQELNTLIYHKNDLAGLRMLLNDHEVVTQNRLVEGWKNGRAFDYLEITHMRGSMFQNQGEILGFDRTQEFATAYYVKGKRGYSPKVKTGMEHFAPIINVTVQEPESYDVYGEYTIRMFAGAGISVESPQMLFYKNGLTA